jgi:hypothetical protein
MSFIAADRRRSRGGVFWCFDDLLRRTPARILAEILSWRWIAIRRTKWEVLTNDMEFARERIALTRAAWFRLLLTACDGVAWIAEDSRTANYGMHSE